MFAAIVGPVVGYCMVLFGDAIFLDCIGFDLLINVTAGLKPLASHFVALVMHRAE